MEKKKISSVKIKRRSGKIKIAINQTGDKKKKYLQQIKICTDLIQNSS